ncbi:unnamed protein product [Boreogadus saida]
MKPHSQCLKLKITEGERDRGWSSCDRNEELPSVKRLSEPLAHKPHPEGVSIREKVSRVCGYVEPRCRLSVISPGPGVSRLQQELMDLHVEESFPCFPS